MINNHGNYYNGVNISSVENAMSNIHIEMSTYMKRRKMADGLRCAVV